MGIFGNLSTVCDISEITSKTLKETLCPNLRFQRKAICLSTQKKGKYSAMQHNNIQSEHIWHTHVDQDFETITFYGEWAYSTTEQECKIKNKINRQISPLIRQKLSFITSFGLLRAIKQSVAFVFCVVWGLLVSHSLAGITTRKAYGSILSNPHLSELHQDIHSHT